PRWPYTTLFRSHRGPAVPGALDAVPGPPARFIGRAQDLDQITARLDPAPTPRSVVVSVLAGMGGVGKTALALKAAQVAWESGWFCAHLFVEDRKSTRLNSSHVSISYAVFCLKKKRARQRHGTCKTT